jgi:hypothetical protein
MVYQKYYHVKNQPPINYQGAVYRCWSFSVHRRKNPPVESPVYNMIMYSPITNSWGSAQTVVLDLSETIIHRARLGRAYHHHPHILAVGDRLFASFSSGVENEDDLGQEVLWTTSTNLGQNWSQPRAIVSPPEGEYAQAILTATGLYTFNNPANQLLTSLDHIPLIAYYGKFEYAPQGMADGKRLPADAMHTNTACFATMLSDGGITWGQPIPILSGFIANHSPQQIRSGRLLMPGGTLFPFTDDPSGLSGWQKRGLPGLPADHVDDSAGYQRMISLDQARFGYCEGSVFQTDDDVLHMMLRTPHKHLAVTESTDNGESWSPVLQTDFSDNTSRHQFGRLPDGRFFSLSTPNPEPSWDRTPLVLAISEDGIHFDRHFILGAQPNHPPRFPGLHKGGRYGYPAMTIIDEWVVVIYSVAKEDVACIRFPLSVLS